MLQKIAAKNRPPFYGENRGGGERLTYSQTEGDGHTAAAGVTHTSGLVSRRRRRNGGDGP